MSLQNDQRREAAIQAAVGKERAFLHDIASPVGCALFVADSFSELLKEGPLDPVVASEMIEKILSSLGVAKAKIESRRAILVVRGDSK